MRSASEAPAGMAEQVVLLDETGRAAGIADKRTVHHGATPRHLAFSCYVFDADDNVLLTQRSGAKLTFPGVWTNTVCGHPAPGETMTAAVCRRARDELGLVVEDLRLVLPRFAYVAEMNGVVENELCPVFVGRAVLGTAVSPDPAEVDATRWHPWAQVCDAVLAGERPVSPWCADQVRLLASLGPTPADWPDGDPLELPAAAVL
ncbi:MAG: isopentenyl-diphosphate Delta-isomerase [Nostocoides sp.]